MGVAAAPQGLLSRHPFGAQTACGQLRPVHGSAHPFTQRRQTTPPRDPHAVGDSRRQREVGPVSDLG